jgi:hypothetical protein
MEPCRDAVDLDGPGKDNYLDGPGKDNYGLYFQEVYQ